MVSLFGRGFESHQLHLTRQCRKSLRGFAALLFLCGRKERTIVDPADVSLPK